ncbi:family 31 glycosyl hydrolase [Lasiosphaeria hispida]|uniref:alpha-glucosidase n=1 Tax=Lasiosphaeria hispida TaxID=260671 RepID=A0AAJ0MB69_9PEZI|nr:family 31 glycosyl hydrolase [Lasiosphaeria hispida]
MLHQHEQVPRQYELVGEESGDVPDVPLSITLMSTDSIVSGSFVFQFEAIRDDIFRVSFTSNSHPVPPYPSARRPDTKLRNRLPIETVTDSQGTTKIMRTGVATASIEWSHAPVVRLYHRGAKEPIYQDLAFRSYAVDGTGIAHYSSYKQDSLYVGLGEKAAPMNLSGRGFIIAASDTFGYDSYRTDPMYKHIPLLINATRDGCVGIFSTSHSRATWSVGSEIDGLWGKFKVYRQAYGGLEQYLIVGKTLKDVVYSYGQIVGFPLLVPRYMLGYIGGGMKYSMQDIPRAADSIVGFIDKCRENDIPISAFQMSSGYTVAETEPKTRNVFTWNRHRFPDPMNFTRQCHQRGVRLLANIKPYVLSSHPEYDRLANAGAFFKDPVSGSHAVARLWSAGGGESGEGSHIDFSSKAGFGWWYQNCRALKQIGIDAMWNDNNEFTIPNDDWECALETVQVPAGEKRRDIGYWGRAMHTELMGKSSHDACLHEVPNERPLVLTRSATPGTMRYASCSWGGDNVTSWEGMRGGNALALNAGISLLQCYGHDIGGFEGPQPTAEHLVRWIQLGVHSPRFAINCYKTSPDDNLIGEVIEPWMHPNATPIIRTAIKRRYKLIPYIYALSLKSYLDAVPPQRWTGWGFEADPVVWSKDIMAGDTQYWLGDTLLVSGVYEPGKTSVDVYLPKSDNDSDFGYLNTNAPFQHLISGKWHNIVSTWETSIPVLARCGFAIPIGKSQPTKCYKDSRNEKAEDPGMAMDDWRGVEIFPPPASLLAQDGRSTISFKYSWLEDDGISTDEKTLACLCHINIEYVAWLDNVGVIGARIVVVTSGDWEPLWVENGVDIILPVGDMREIVPLTSEEWSVTNRGHDVEGRAVWNLDVELTSENADSMLVDGGPG